MIKARVTYRRLWKTLIDRGMKRKDLQAMTGLSPTTLAKLTRGENVTTDVLARICLALGCDLEDVAEIVREEIKEEKERAKELSGHERL